MSSKVYLRNKSADEIMNVIRQMRANGLVQGSDFDFKFNFAKTEFTFYKEKPAVYFALRWSSNLIDKAV